MLPAPILLFVYNRPTHTLKTLNALRQNKLSDQSELFIFSDGYKSEADKAEVEKVRLQRQLSFHTHAAPAGERRKRFVGNSLECIAVFGRHAVA